MCINACTVLVDIARDILIELYVRNPANTIIAVLFCPCYKCNVSSYIVG